MASRSFDLLNLDLDDLDDRLLKDKRLNTGATIILDDLVPFKNTCYESVGPVFH